MDEPNYRTIRTIANSSQWCKQDQISYNQSNKTKTKTKMTRPRPTPLEVNKNTSHI